MSVCLFSLPQTRHQRGDTHHLTLDEILDETKLLDIGMKQKQWLMSEVCVFVFVFAFVSEATDEQLVLG